MITITCNERGYWIATIDRGGYLYSSPWLNTESQAQEWARTRK